jgi:hypothetical protein
MSFDRLIKPGSSEESKTPHLKQDFDKKEEKIIISTYGDLAQFLQENSLPNKLDFVPKDVHEQKQPLPKAINLLSHKLATAQENMTLCLVEGAFHCVASSNFFVNSLRLAPVHFNLIIQNNHTSYSKNSNLITSLIKAFQKGECQHWKEGFTLIIDNENAELTLAIAKALENEHLPIRFNYLPRFNANTDDINNAAHALLSALKSKKKQKGEIGIGFCSSFYRAGSFSRKLGSIYELALDDKITYTLHLDLSRIFFKMGSFPQDISPYLYFNHSIASLTFSYRMISDPATYTHMFDELANVLKVNDTLTEISVDVDQKTVAKKFKQSYLKIEPLLKSNLYTHNYQKFHSYLPILQDFIAEDTAKIVLSYLSGEPRKMHQEVAETLQNDELFIAVRILEHHPHLLDKYVAIDINEEHQQVPLKQFIKHYLSDEKRIGTCKTVTLPFYENPRDPFNSRYYYYAFTETSLRETLKNLLKTWEASQTPQPASNTSIFKRKPFQSQPMPESDKALALRKGSKK